MQIYLVGGAVRDALLGLQGADRDWVVVGSTPEELAEKGFVPVGRDFPVFLHPQTHEEYALARTERKSGRGYRGFVVQAEPSVTLEQDLARRDLTINSIAARAHVNPADSRFDADFGALTDPFNGRADLERKVLRHVTDAFSEDPVRILRVARFAARFADFSVAPETLALMRHMVESGEADALVAERVWQELARGLMERTPSRMLDVLADCGALAALLPELGFGPDRTRLGDAPQRATDAAARMAAPLEVRFACLCLGARSPQALQDLCSRWRVPNICRELAELVLRERDVIDAAGVLSATGLVRLLERCDAFRKPARFAHALLVCACVAETGPAAALADSGYAPQKRLLAALAAAQAVATDTVAGEAQAAGQSGPAIGQAVHDARVLAVCCILKNLP